MTHIAPSQYTFYSNVRLRVYFQDKKEHLELIGQWDGKDELMYEASAIPGEWAADFLYGSYDWALKKAVDFQMRMNRLEQNDDTQSTWEQMLGHAQNLPQASHPYFSVLTQLMFSLHDAGTSPDGSQWKLRNLRQDQLLKELRALPEDIRVLGTDVLNLENDADGNVAARFWRCRTEKKFAYEELTYGQVQNDILGKKRGHLYKKPHRRAEVLTPDELLQRGIEPEIVEVLYPQTLRDLYLYEKAYCLRNDVHFRACKNCGRLFAVQGNSKVEYCDRAADAGSSKTCRQIGAVRLYQKKQQKNPAIQAYTKAYKTRNARIRYGIITKEQFQKWAVEARTMRDRCVAGEVSLQELEEWLSRD